MALEIYYNFAKFNINTLNYFTKTYSNPRCTNIQNIYKKIQKMYKFND